MKRFNEFIKRLSLTQQMFALIFFFVSFFAVFFFVYINGSVNNVIKEQIFETLDKSIMSVKPSTDADKQIDLYRQVSDIEVYTATVHTNDGTTGVNFNGNHVADINKDSQEWQMIAKDIVNVNLSKTKDVRHGVIKHAKGDADSYYSIVKLADNTFAVAKAYSNNMEKLENGLINSVVYITVIVVGFFFIILMMWVITLIHPLNQIRNYIERVKLGKDAQLHVN